MPDFCATKDNPAMNAEMNKDKLQKKCNFFCVIFILFKLFNLCDNNSIRIYRHPKSNFYLEKLKRINKYMYTIKEVAKKMNISEHTIRFWAKSGFFPFVKRDENNIRLFSDDDLNWVKMVKCLRSVGTENKAIKRYIDLCIKGDSTIKERYGIIQTTKEKALKQLEEVKKQLELLEYKEKFYQNLIKNNLKDCWNPMNNNFRESKCCN